MLVMLGFVEALSRQRLLFASLASSAFLIYLDPNHGTNSARTLLISQLSAAGIGFLTYIAGGAGYISAAVAMVATIVLMIVFDVVHPPAVSTCLSFALRAGSDSNLMLFSIAVGIVVILLLLEQTTLWLLARLQRDE